MARRFPELKDGDRLEPVHLNIIYRELNRWRSLQAVPPMRIAGAEDGVSNIEISGPPSNSYLIKLTATGDANGKHGWKNVLWNGTAYVDTGRTGDANGDWAIEVNTLRCPRGDEVYAAWRNRWNVMTFKAVRAIGVASADINANSNGTVYLWSEINGTLSNTSNSITVFNWNDTTKVTSGKRVMLTPHSRRWLVDFEVC